MATGDSHGPAPHENRAAGGPGPLLAFAAALLVALALLALAAWRLGVPALADAVAGQVPREWERELGDGFVADLAAPAARITDPVVREPVQRVFEILVSEGAAGSEPARLLIARDGQVNAFAAPGGTVVVTSGLLRELRTPQELAAVLAHELGHVRERHALRGLLRQAGLRVLLALVAGDQSLLSGALHVAGGLGGLSYSREFEREADDSAIRSLERLGLTPGALSAALGSIRRASPAGGEIGFLSTHPAPAERLARLERAAGPVARAAKPLVTEEGWKAMQASLPAARSAKATR